MSLDSARELITAQVQTWAGITVEPHRFDGQAFYLGRREIGHIHGDYLLDVPLPTRLRDEVVAAGRAHPHHILPQSGWVSFYIQSAADGEAAIALLRLSYEVARKRKSKRRPDSD